ncbi:MAG: NUDIX domain-containing protein [Bacteroidia bacterium]
MKPSRFMVRVYGILMLANKQILISHEQIGSKKVTKFPGGGLEFGESTIQCLKREFLEEAGLAIEVGDHFYTTDFFVQNHFEPAEQVIGVYYFVSLAESGQVQLRDGNRTNYKHLINELRQEWLPLSELIPDNFTFPADQVVAQRLLSLFK